MSFASIFQHKFKLKRNVGVTEYTDVISSTQHHGLACIWRGKIFDDCQQIGFSWKLRPIDVDFRHVYAILGYITLKLEDRTEHRIPFYIEEEMAEVYQEFVVVNSRLDDSCLATFEYCLNTYQRPHVPDELDEVMTFQGVPANLEFDGVQEGVILNKEFLNLYSGIFRHELYSTEHEFLKNMPTEDFKLLLSVFPAPEAVITDDNLEHVLQLAANFQMLFVFNCAEKHLLEFSNIDEATKVSIAIKYGLEHLLERMIRQVDTGLLFQLLSPCYSENSEISHGMKRFVHKHLFYKQCLYYC